MTGVVGQMALAGLPYWVPAVLALFWAFRAPGKLPKVWRFANPYALLGIGLVSFRIASIPVSALLFSALGCEGGLIDPVSCSHAADWAGTFLDRFGFIGTAVVSAVGLPSLIVCALAEVVTRRRRGRP